MLVKKNKMSYEKKCFQSRIWFMDFHKIIVTV